MQTKIQAPKFRALALGFTLLAGGFAAGAVAQQQQDAPAKPVPGEIALVMTIEVDGEANEYVLDEKMRMGECVAGLKGLGKPSFRQHEGVAISQTFACVRDYAKGD